MRSCIDSITITQLLSRLESNKDEEEVYLAQVNFYKRGRLLEPGDAVLAGALEDVAAVHCPVVVHQHHVPCRKGSYLRLIDLCITQI